MVGTLLSYLVNFGFIALGAWVSLKPNPERHKLYGGAFIILGIIGLILTYYNQKEFDKAQRELTDNIRNIEKTVSEIKTVIIPEVSKTQTAEKIQIGLQYAYEWDRYKGSTNTVGDTWRAIDDEPIKRKYSQEEMRLLLGVQNTHREISIKDVWLNVFFLADNLDVRIDKIWRSMFPNKHYFAKLGNINSGQGIHPDGNLFIKFPKPGIYKVSYSINADGFKPILGNFQIVLEN
jgi:hypothetical protein